MKSMKRMQDIQPQIQKLREKYKDDKAAINKATMELFREQKVNPLGGCWPMFLQLPVFIALYQALSYAIELRHAPFVCIPSIFLCINDLSAPDPYYVTPILMGGTMVLQQWMTPSGGDPTQKKMMLLMPVVFTYLFLSFPSGLVLYWLVSNVLSIAQQVITNKMAD
jgi:YidC/Oxa1 family membrane protein insertase